MANNDSGALWAALNQMNAMVRPRGYDPKIAGRFLGQLANRGREIGTGTANQIGRGLQARGLGRSAGMFGAAGAGARAQGDFLGPALNAFQMGEQQFTEGARQFDINSYLALRNLFLKGKEVEYNKPPSFAIDTPLGGVSF